jgi:hypothetical protein
MNSSLANLRYILCFCLIDSSCMFTTYHNKLAAVYLEVLATAVIAVGIRSSACQYSLQPHLTRVTRSTIATNVLIPTIL